MHTPPIYATSTLEVHIHILSILDTFQNCSTPTLGVSIKKFPFIYCQPLLLRNKAPSIPFTTTSIHISKKRLGCSKKRKKEKKEKKREKKKKNKIKRTNVPT
jgi:hypothetical protein